MSTALAILVLDTIIALGQPVTAICPAEAGCMVATTSQEIIKICDDTVVARISSVSGKILSNISDVAFSGLRIWISIPVLRKILSFTLNLDFCGEVDLDFYPDQITISPLGDFFALDKSSGCVLRFDETGNVVQRLWLDELGLSPRTSLIGAALPDKIRSFLVESEFDESFSGEYEPLLFDREERLLWCGERIEIPENIENIWFSGGKLFALRGDTLDVFGAGKLISPIKPDEVVLSADNIYFSLNGRILTARVKWHR